MKYLTYEETRILSAISSYPYRPLNKIERALRTLIEAIKAPVAEGQEMVREQALRHCLMGLQQLTSNVRLLTLAHEATHSQTALKILISGYPYLEFEGYLRDPKLHGVLLAGYRNVEFDHLRAGAQWVASLHDVVNQLPTDVELFLHTPPTPHNLMIKAAKLLGRKDCYGLTLPETLQARINGLFGQGYRFVRETVQEYELHNGLDHEQRFGIKNIFEPAEPDSGYVYSNTVVFSSDVFGGYKYNVVEVIRFKVKDCHTDSVWVGTYKFVTGLA